MKVTQVIKFPDYKFAANHSALDTANKNIFLSINLWADTTAFTLYLYKAANNIPPKIMGFSK